MAKMIFKITHRCRKSTYFPQKTAKHVKKRYKSYTESIGSTGGSDLKSGGLNCYGISGCTVPACTCVKIVQLPCALCRRAVSVGIQKHVAAPF